jgi:hypothetical protein
LKNLLKGDDVMVSQPRWTHSFSLNKKDEQELEKIIEQNQTKDNHFGIIDVVKEGIRSLKAKQGRKG